MKKLILLLGFVVLGWQANAQTYCVGGPSFTGDSNVEAVNLVGESTSIAYTGCPGVTGVEDQTSQVADLIAGSTYTIDVQFGTCGGNYASAGEVWIDYNLDFIFQPSESLGTLTGTPPLALSSFTFTVPADAIDGTSRLRVIQQEGGALPLDPCAGFNWGSVVDFGISISGGTALSCQIPFNVSTTNPTTDTVDVSWDPEANATNGYIWEVYNLGDDPTVASPVASGTFPTGTSSGQATGLPFDTDLELYLASDCGPDGISDLNGPSQFTTTELCSLPSTFDTSSLLPDSATLNWASIPNATGGYLWSVFNAGDDPASATPVASGTAANTDTSVTVTGLIQNTQYEAYITTDCGADGQSLQSVALAFATPCNAFAAPFFENFESASWVSGTGFANAGDAIDPCWSRNPETGFFWGTRTGQTGSGGTGPDIANSGLNYVFVEGSGGGAAGTEAFFVSPLIDISSLSNPALSFFYHMFGGNMGTLAVDIDPGTGYDLDVFTISGQQQTAIGDPWTEQFIDLNAYAGQTIQVRFRGVKDAGFATDMSIDDVRVDEAPTCLAPINLAATNVLSETATLNWDNVSSATNGYVWSLYTSPSDPVVDTPIASGTTGAGIATVDVTGLLPVTAYDFYVSADCDANGTSNLAGPFSFTTLCAPAALNYEEDFTTLTFDLTASLACWDGGTGFFTPTGSSGWNAGPFNNDASNPNGTALYTNLYSTGTFWASSQSIDLGAGDPNYVLSYDALVIPWSGPGPVTDMGPHEVTVVISTDGGVTWDLSNTLAVYNTSNIPNDVTSTLQTISLDGYSGVVKIGFYADETGFSPDLRFYIDNVFVGTPPLCSEPLNLNATAVTSDTATLNWDDDASATNGYVWSVYTSPSDPAVDAPVASGTTGVGIATADVTGLLPVTAYDFYVSADCDAVGVSSLAGPSSFTTTCAVFIPDYIEDFTSFVPTCWEEASAGDPATGPSGLGFGDWGPGNFLNSGTDTSAKINLWNLGTSSWLISPSFDLSAGGYEAKFDVGKTEYFGTGDEPMGSDDEVQFLYTDDGGLTWNTLITWDVTNQPTNTGDVSITDLSSITGSNVQFAFWASEGTVDDPEDYDFFIDNFEIRAMPPCPDPTGLSVSNIAIDAADINWDNDASATNGYIWSVYTSPSDPAVDAPVATGTTAAGMTMAQATGLFSATDYDVYVQADCDTDGTSNLVGPGTFTTLSDFCGGDLFYDNGGLAGLYANNSNETITISPAVAGDVVSVEFLLFVTEFNFDGLVIYDGPDTSAPLFDSGFVNPGFGTLIDGTWTGDAGDNYSPLGQTFTSSHPSGALTFVFTSDGSGTELGWEAVVTCAPAPVADVQIIHNSADPAAQFVDVYVDGNIAYPNFGFRTASAFVQLPAGVPIDIDIAPAGSTGVADSVYNLNTTFVENETYIVVADGVLDPAQFDTSVNASIGFNLEVYSGAQQTSPSSTETSLLLHHGSTDAPLVDAVEVGAGAGPLADDIGYTDFQGYLEVTTDDYIVNIELADNSAVVATYEANLASLLQYGSAITVLASGFLDPVSNQNGPAFGLWVALPVGGPLVELPVVFPEPLQPAPDPTEDPADVISLFSGVYTDVTVDTFLTPWSASFLSNIQIQGNDTKLYSNLDFAGIETVTAPVDASGMDFFHIDIWSPNATTFRVKIVNDLGGNQSEGEIAFNIGQEQWISLDIPLDDFADPNIVTDPNNLLQGREAIAQYIISGLPVGAVVAYIDNIYFSRLPISTAGFDFENFSFYPSPAKSTLYLNSTLQIDEVKVFNMLGQEVIRENPNTLTPQINVEALQTGTYIMNVSIDGTAKNFRFIKE